MSGRKFTDVDSNMVSAASVGAEAAVAEDPFATLAHLSAQAGEAARESQRKDFWMKVFLQHTNDVVSNREEYAAKISDDALAEFDKRFK